MNMYPMFCLIAVFAGPLHAQTCSGGADGGIDATGNQCSDASTIGAYVNGSEIALTRPTAKMSGIQQSIAAPIFTRVAAKMSSTPAKTTVSAQEASRIAKAAPPPIPPVKTAKIETVDASSCSGGADGGMDATGNQCSEHPVALMNTGRILAAKP